MNFQLRFGIICGLIICLVAFVAAQSDQDDCSSNFFALEQSLLQSTDNRFHLLQSFYPPRQAHPVLLRVNYTFDGVDNSTQMWFWSESEFYLIQPLEIFQFTSLLFSDMPYRSGQVSLVLAGDCSLVPQEYLQLLTTKLKLYAQSATTGALSGTRPISDDYLAIAISMEQVSEDSLQSDFVKVWLHVTVALFPLGTWLLLYLCDPIQLLLGDKTWTKLEDEHSHGTIAAMIQISVIFTVYVFVLDLAGVYYTVTNSFLLYDTSAAFYLSTVTGLAIDLGAFVWVVIVMATSCHQDCKNFFQRARKKKVCKGSDRMKKLVSTMTVAPVLCFSNHLLYIIIAFISDPFHAGSIAITYTIASFLYFFMFRQFYNRLVLHSNKRPKIIPRMQVCPQCSAREKLWHPLHKIASNMSSVPLTNNMDQEERQVFDTSDVKCDCFIPGPDCHTPFNTQILVVGLFTVGPLVAVYLGLMVVLFFSLPITKSLENAPSRIYVLYQGTGLIIVALLTYNILLHPNPFSVTKTLERIAKRLRLPESTNYWNRLSIEEKCAKVIVTLLESQLQNGKQDNVLPRANSEEEGITMEAEGENKERRRKNCANKEDPEVVSTV